MSTIKDTLMGVFFILEVILILMMYFSKKINLYEATYGDIDEYVVPMGYSLKQWKKKKKKEKISNKDYAEKTKGDKWKVVHGKTKGKIGKPIGDHTKNLSYKKATAMHTAIELSEIFFNS